MDIPPNFDDDFLSWFRDRTNEAWADWPTRPFSSYQLVGGLDWERGTKWVTGIPDPQIDRIELEWSVRFPPDYRLFLRRLHATDRPMKGAKFKDSRNLVPLEEPSFYNWQRDHAALRRSFAWPLEGLLFDIEQNDLWLEGWGPKPEQLDARKARLTELVKHAPRLIPIYRHSYLLAEPCIAGNPVFDVYQDDITIDGANLRSSFLFQFADLVGLNRHQDLAEVDQKTIQRVEAVPFWGELIANNY